jgi:hypothetical protein
MRLEDLLGHVGLIFSARLRKTLSLVSGNCRLSAGKAKRVVGKANTVIEFGQCNKSPETLLG